jgi:hypothetical protein
MPYFERWELKCNALSKTQIKIVITDQYIYFDYLHHSADSCNKQFSFFFRDNLPNFLLDLRAIIKQFLLAYTVQTCSAYADYKVTLGLLEHNFCNTTE